MALVQTVEELYQDSSLYSTPDMFSPPSERKSYVIRFELTMGCNWSGCTYCGGYDGVKHAVKTLDEYKEHVNEVWGRIGKGSDLATNLRRIFIGGGNALEVETDMLNEAIQFTREKFRENTGHSPSRVAVYGRTNDILRQGKRGLDILYTGARSFWKRHFFRASDASQGLGLIYWGVESGSNDVLDYVNKGCEREDIIRAANCIKKIVRGFDFLETSVMVMPGLGGARFYDEHIRGTASILGIIRPRFITFMGVNPASNSRYARKMAEEQKAGTNRPLTDREMALQMIEILRWMKTDHFPSYAKMGCFPCSIDGVGYSPLTFNSVYSYPENKNRLVAKLDRELCLKFPN